MLRFEFNFAPLYYWSLTQNDVPSITHIPLEDLRRSADGLIEYFNSGTATPQNTVVKDGKSTPLFNERELIHLSDVKGLVRLDYSIQAVSLIVLLLAIFGIALAGRDTGMNAVGTALHYGSVFPLLLAGMLITGSFVAFNELFTLFHVVSFDNPFWQLDPTRDHLIMMFPEPFWYASVVLALAGIVLTAVCLGVLGWFLRRQDGPMEPARPCTT
jgi:integral membrane protein (TIGR01906 family)